ncbi:formate dehydrogenase accessory sulfurtransferase FdhD [Azomonas macrocytogenes]|uniref:Sulfur carrier protein FdhD n=1 Tax=Azomonas macrocytogenes TaxID=69962 RepID=A0A839SZ42_AZOMA|nr:formate dehydrogenase accessory sulfurtransferase FdhD [Azomonas macrocytogenes]MBB3101959.1 FdhD protein [Azomonas macrocytogenes]
MISINIPPATAEPSETLHYDGMASSDYLDMHTRQQASAQLIEEMPLAISYNGLGHAVMMVTPRDLEDFLFGFSLSEGVINSADEIRDWSIEAAPLSCHLDTSAATALAADIHLSPRVLDSLKQTRKRRQGATGCGICGIESLDEAMPPLPRLEASPPPPLSQLEPLRDYLFSQQTLGGQAGAIHAAALLDPDGQLLACREDIGRHNALDKLIGASLRARRDLRGHAAVMSSRCSTELIQKALRAGLSTLIHLASPSVLAVQLARRQGLNLIHLPRHSGPRLYAGAALDTAPCAHKETP